MASFQRKLFIFFISPGREEKKGTPASCPTMHAVTKAWTHGILRLYKSQTKATRKGGRGGEHRDKERKLKDEQKQEQGIDMKWTHRNRKRSIGQPTHEHQLRLQLHHPPWTDRNEKEEDRREGEEEDEDRKKNRGTNQTKTEEIEQRKT